jgi:hypothetical protein
MKPRNVASAHQHSLTHSLCYVSHTLKYLPFKRSAVIGRAIIFAAPAPRTTTACTFLAFCAACTPHFTIPIFYREPQELLFCSFLATKIIKAIFVM